jgi:hypothetical protein
MIRWRLQFVRQSEDIKSVAESEVGVTDLLGRNWKLTQPTALAANEGAP